MRVIEFDNGYKGTVQKNKLFQPDEFSWALLRGNNEGCGSGTASSLEAAESALKAAYKAAITPLPPPEPIEEAPLVPPTEESAED